MKKIALSLVAASMAATAFAHDGNNRHCFQMGNILLYGVGSYSNTHGTTSSKYATANTSTTDQPRMLNWEVSPGVGFNITDNLTVGIDLRYTGSKTTYDRKTLSFSPYAEDQVKSFDYGVGPFVRYTHPIGEHFFAYGQAQAHYLRGRLTTRTVTAQVGGNSFVRDDNYKGVDASFMPALGIMVTHSLGLSFGFGGVGYSYTKVDYSTQGQPAGSESTAKNNEFFVTFGNQFNVGIQKYFGCGMMHRHHAGGDEDMNDRHMDTTDDTMDNDSDKKKKKRNDDE